MAQEPTIATRAPEGQALLDVLTMAEHVDTFEGLTVSIVGDVTHSRSPCRSGPRFRMPSPMCSLRFGL